MIRNRARLLLVKCFLRTDRRAMTHRVFVYGTLKRNEPNHHWLTEPKNGSGVFVTEGKTSTKYPLIIGTKYNIPLLLYQPGKGYNVKGEVYEVDQQMLGNLDLLEDHPTFYTRQIEDIIIEKRSAADTGILKCWVYFIKNFNKRLLSKPSIENYSSTGPHGLEYVERSRRDANDYHNKNEIL